METLRLELGEHGGVIRVRHDDARRLEPLGGDGFQSLARHHLAALSAEIPCHLLDLVETNLFGRHRRAFEQSQRVGGHGGVVREPARQVGIHDFEPLAHVDDHGGGLRVARRVHAAFAEHDHARARRTSPALLRRAQDGVHAGRLHVHPNRAARDGIEHEQPPVRVHGVGHSLDVRIRQNDPSRRLHVRREHHRGFFLVDHLHDLRQGRWRERRRLFVVHRASSHHDRLARDLRLLKNIRPSIAKVPITNHERLFPAAPLSRDRLHPVRPASRHDHHAARVVRPLHHPVDVLHRLAEHRRHVIDRSIRVHDGVLLQSTVVFERERAIVEPLIAEVAEVVRARALRAHAPLRRRHRDVARRRRRRVRRGRAASETRVDLFARRAERASSEGVHRRRRRARRRVRGAATRRTDARRPVRTRVPAHTV